MTLPVRRTNGVGGMTGLIEAALAVLSPKASLQHAMTGGRRPALSSFFADYGHLRAEQEREQKLGVPATGVIRLPLSADRPQSRPATPGTAVGDGRKVFWKRSDSPLQDAVLAMALAEDAARAESHHHEAPTAAFVGQAPVREDAIEELPPLDAYEADMRADAGREDDYDGPGF